mgnify:CR=1 FL=1|tara:strand:- start:1321 stop:1581 length:261 start_codon:yes stop_codon:yes gene_type:complete
MENITYSANEWNIIRKSLKPQQIIDMISYCIEKYNIEYPFVKYTEDDIKINGGLILSGSNKGVIILPLKDIWEILDIGCFKLLIEK